LRSDHPVEELHKIAKRFLEEENISRASRIIWLVEYL